MGPEPTLQSKFVVKSTKTAQFIALQSVHKPTEAKSALRWCEHFVAEVYQL